MHKVIRTVLLSLFTVIIGCSVQPRSAEEQLVLGYRDIMLESAAIGVENRTVNVVILGLTEEAEGRIRDRFFRPDPDGKVALVDVTRIEERGKFKTLDGTDYADEARIEIIEWIDEQSVILETSYHGAPLMGGGGKYEMRFDGKKWDVIKELESWIS